MSTIIDRYIGRMFLGYFFAGIIVFVTLFVVVDFMSTMVRFEAHPSLLMEYYLLYIPGIVYMMIPVACLLSTVFTLGTLSKNNELVALFSSGMSLARISLPILVAVVFISGLAFWLSDRVLPVVTQKKNYVYYVQIRNQPGLYSTVKTNRIWYRSQNIIFNIKTLQPEKSEAQGLTMYYFDNAWQLVQMITAAHVSLNKSNWDLKNGTVTLLQSESEVPVTQTFESKTVVMDEDAADLQSTSGTADTLSLRDLQKFIQRNKEAGLQTVRYEVDYHSKFSFAFAAFVMSFIGIPFSVSRQRSGSRILNIGVCVGLAFTYWAFYSSGITMGQHGALPPMIAVWLPNFVILALSVVLLFRLKR